MHTVHIQLLRTPPCFGNVLSKVHSIITQLFSNCNTYFEFFYFIFINPNLYVFCRPTCRKIKLRFYDFLFIYAENAYNIVNIIRKNQKYFLYFHHFVLAITEVLWYTIVCCIIILMKKSAKPSRATVFCSRPC